VEHETEHDENSMEIKQDAHIAHKPHQHVGHHESMVEDFKKRLDFFDSNYPRYFSLTNDSRSIGFR